jgi:hypothetical protein
VPPCAGTFGAYEKLWSALALPVATCVVLGVYAGVQYARSTRVTPAEFAKRHAGRNVFTHLSQQILTVTVSLFIFGSIFFLRNVLVTFDCTAPETLDGPTFLKVEPSIQCSDNPDYNTLYYMSSMGVFIYMCM